MSFTEDSNHALRNGSGETWAEKVAKGRKEKIPNAMLNKDLFGEQINIIHETIYEDHLLRDHLRIHKAEQIAQRTLEENSVLFELSKKHGLSNKDIYKLIESQIGEIEGVTPYSRHGNTRGTNLLGVNFKESKHAEEAIEKGFILDEILYKASPCRVNNSATPPKMVRVLLDYIPKKQAELVDGIFLSMSIYGKVCQIKKLTNDGYFEGQVSVLLDTNNTDEAQKYQPLQRMLYLSFWDSYMPASYKGAPPVCFQCRQSGHIRKDCPLMKQITCSRCLVKGHIARFCKEKNSDIEKDMIRYELLKEEQHKKKQAIMNQKSSKDETLSYDEKKEKKGDLDITEVVTSSQVPKVTEGKVEALHKANIVDGKTTVEETKIISLNKSEGNKTKSTLMEVDPKDVTITKVTVDQDGLNASKHAPITKRTTMDIDSESMAMEIDSKRKSSTNSVHQEKIISNQVDMLRMTTAKAKSRLSIAASMTNPHASLVLDRKKDNSIPKDPSVKKGSNVNKN